MYLTPEQHAILLRPLNGTRVATRRQGGKDLSYLEAWDVKAHLTRVFGFGNWDSEIIREQCMGVHQYSNRDGKAMGEVMWQVTLRLIIRTTNPQGEVEHTVYSEAAVGSATGSLEGAGMGDLHDNAIKGAASDALKRCAINLGTQFGLSLYNDGSRVDVIKKVLVGAPVEDAPEEPKEIPKDQAEALAKSVGLKTKDVEPEALLAEELGATPIEEN